MKRYHRLPDHAVYWVRPSFVNYPGEEWPVAGGKCSVDFTKERGAAPLRTGVEAEIGAIASGGVPAGMCELG